MYTNIGYYMSPVPTKWEISRNTLFPSYIKIHIVQIKALNTIY